MAKPDSLIYIKRYLKTFENVEETECVDSTYYKVGAIKIRVSNHSKKQTKETNKYHVSIVQPINDTKQYIVTIRGSLAMNIMTLSQVKEFVRNYLLIKQMDKFKIEDYDDETKESDEITTEIKSEEVLNNFNKVASYIKKYHKWYKKCLSDNAGKYLRRYIIENINRKDKMEDLLKKIGEQIVTTKIYNKDEIATLILSLKK